MRRTHDKWLHKRRWHLEMFLWYFSPVSLKICDTFSGYLHGERHSPRFSWIRPLLKPAEMVLSGCQTVEGELSLDSPPLDSMTGLWCGNHFLLAALGIFQCLKTTKWWITGISMFTELLILLCHLVVCTRSAAAVCVHSSPLPGWFLFSGGVVLVWLQVKISGQVSSPSQV